ncbi:MAG TPA: ATP synthase F1 subunit epsilon [Candidatus Saccharimonadales bacterium]|nr:ATP synthase F1 subunit epsilon [Candidatus Saccharimonadales bacterium]
MKFQLITLTGVKFDQDIAEVSLPTAAGQIAVLPHHEPLVSLAVPGVITVRQKATDGDDKLEHFATEGGIVEVTSTGVRILVDEADHASEIHEAEAQKALQRALDMRAKAKDKVELDHAQQLIDRAQVRLQVANLRRRHRER